MKNIAAMRDAERHHAGAEDGQHLPRADRGDLRARARRSSSCRRRSAGKAVGQINMIGTGPYQFGEYKPDSHVKMTPLRRLRGRTRPMTSATGSPARRRRYFDSVTVRIVPEGGARTAGLQSGELHVLEALDPAAAKRLKDDKIDQDLHDDALGVHARS
jgi:ABC-type transport system substrate-binding protein